MCQQSRRHIALIENSNLGTPHANAIAADVLASQDISNQDIDGE